jgi:predicted O-methyltransferase YrrM
MRLQVNALVKCPVSCGASEGLSRIARCESAFIEEIYRERTLPLVDGSRVPMDVYIPREQGDLLYSLVRKIKPLQTVEIGMANGLSTYFMAQALSENGRGKHVAIDPYQKSDWNNVGVGLLRLASLNQSVQLLELPSHQALPMLEGQGVRAQVVFVDGSHLFDYVMTDFVCADRILDVGGVIAFDDSDWPSVSSVIRFALTNRHYEIACPDIVIESTHYAPGAANRMVRAVGKSIPRFGEKLRPDFMRSNYEMGIRGRCVVLRKLRDDDRDSQSRFHESF